MSSPFIEHFLIDEVNEDKISAHNISVYQMLQVLENKHVIVPNRTHRRGLYLIIGLDDGGNCIAIPVERTRDPTIWRPVTAWFCKNSERTILQRKG